MMQNDNSVFDELQTSLKHAVAIRKGTMKPSRVSVIIIRQIPRLRSVV